MRLFVAHMRLDRSNPCPGNQLRRRERSIVSRFRFISITICKRDYYVLFRNNCKSTNLWLPPANEMLSNLPSCLNTTLIWYTEETHLRHAPFRGISNPSGNILRLTWNKFVLPLEFLPCIRCVSRSNSWASFKMSPSQVAATNSSIFNNYEQINNNNQACISWCKHNKT